MSEEPRICGGVVLKPVHLSVLPEPDASCNTMLPPKGNDLTFEPPRRPGPSRGRLASDAPTASPPAPVTGFTLEFTVPYPFDRVVGFSPRAAPPAYRRVVAGWDVDPGRRLAGG